MNKKKLYIIAGEPSGDFLGSEVLESLRIKAPYLEVEGVGGNLMTQKGLCSLFDIEEISIGGFTEIIPHILKVKRLINLTVDDILAKQPDLLLTIDSPDFCFRVARKVRAKNPNIKLMHFVAPSVWAWREGRSKKVADLYDCLLTLFDFEPPYFNRHGLDTRFVGHPAVRKYVSANLERRENEILLLVPGSRKQEIKTHLPIYIEASKKLGYKRVVIPTLPHLESLVKSIVRDNNIEVVTDEQEKLELYQKASLSIVTIGTVLLQLGLVGCPMIACYKMSNLTYAIVRSLVKLKEFAALINIVVGKQIVPELIQSNCTSEKIAETERQVDWYQQRQDLITLKNKLMNNSRNPSEIIAEAILEYVS